MLGSPIAKQIMITLVGFAVLSTSCSEKGFNQLSIDNGKSLSEQSVYKGRGVVAINNGGCTATVVGNNTIITAGHCMRGSGSIICVDSGLYRQDLLGSRLCTNRSYVHPEYVGGGNMGLDLAAAVFEGEPFKDFHPVRTTSSSSSAEAAVGEDVLLTGYSPYADRRPEDGSKNWGLSKIRNLLTGEGEYATIQTVAGNSSAAVGLSGGDSGGPMFDEECRLIGVASRSANPKGATPGAWGLHTNVTYSKNMNWLKSLVNERGARICGIQGTDQSSCVGNFQAKRVMPFLDALEKDSFPCIAQAEMDGAGGSTPDAGDQPPDQNGSGAQPPGQNGSGGQPTGPQNEPRGAPTDADEDSQGSPIALAVFDSGHPGHLGVAVSLIKGSQVRTACIVDQSETCTLNLSLDSAPDLSLERDVYVATEAISNAEAAMGVRVDTTEGKFTIVKFAP